MPPLRFKAVRKSDGLEAFSNFDLLESIMGSNHCAGSIDIDGFFSFDLNSTPDLEDVSICQSTGLTDANGKEVFFNDVLFFKDKSFWVIQFSLNDQYSVIRRLNEKYEICEYTAERPFDLRTIKGLKPKFIGNRWEPIETLKERAEALAK